MYVFLRWKSYNNKLDQFSISLFDYGILVQRMEKSNVFVCLYDYAEEGSILDKTKPAWRITIKVWLPWHNFRKTHLSKIISIQSLNIKHLFPVSKGDMKICSMTSGTVLTNQILIKLSTCLNSGIIWFVYKCFCFFIIRLYYFNQRNVPVYHYSNTD